jgi:hypothetical protein
MPAGNEEGCKVQRRKSAKLLVPAAVLQEERKMNIYEYFFKQFCICSHR